MRVVLLGATGFVGARVLRALAAASIPVTALVRGSAERLQSACDRVVVGALPDVPKSLFSDEPFVLVHAATKQRDEDGTGFAVNAAAARALLAVLPASCRGVVYASSVSVYGAGRQVDVDESTPVRPSTALAASRAEVERLFVAGCEARGAPATILRTRFVIGAGDRFTLPGLLRAFRRGVAIGDEAQRFTVVDVDDYAAIVVALASAPRPLGALHVGYRRPVALAEIREALAKRFALPPVRRRVRMASTVAAALSALPFARARSLGGTLELLAHDHVASVEALARTGFEAVVARDPRTALASAVAALPEDDR